MADARRGEHRLTRLVESRMRGQLARPVREGGQRKRTSRNADTAPLADPTTMSSSPTSTAAGWPLGGAGVGGQVYVVTAAAMQAGAADRGHADARADRRVATTTRTRPAATTTTTTGTMHYAIR